MALAESYALASFGGSIEQQDAARAKLATALRRDPSVVMGWPSEEWRALQDVGLRRWDETRPSEIAQRITETIDSLRAVVRSNEVEMADLRAQLAQAARGQGEAEARARSWMSDHETLRHALESARLALRETDARLATAERERALSDEKLHAEGQRLATETIKRKEAERERDEARAELVNAARDHTQLAREREAAREEAEAYRGALHDAEAAADTAIRAEEASRLRCAGMEAALRWVATHPYGGGKTFGDTEEVRAALADAPLNTVDASASAAQPQSEESHDRCVSTTVPDADRGREGAHGCDQGEGRGAVRDVPGDARCAGSPRDGAGSHESGAGRDVGHEGDHGLDPSRCCLNDGHLWSSPDIDAQEVVCVQCGTPKVRLTVDLGFQEGAARMTYIGGQLIDVQPAPSRPAPEEGECAHEWIDAGYGDPEVPGGVLPLDVCRKCGIGKLPHATGINAWQPTVAEHASPDEQSAAPPAAGREAV